MEHLKLRIGQVLEARDGEEWEVVSCLDTDHLDYKYGHRFLCRDSRGFEYAFSPTGRFRTSKSDSQHDLVKMLQDVEVKNELSTSGYESTPSDEMIGPSTIQTVTLFASSMGLFGMD